MADGASLETQESARTPTVRHALRPAFVKGLVPHCSCGAQFGEHDPLLDYDRHVHATLEAAEERATRAEAAARTLWTLLDATERSDRLVAAELPGCHGLISEPQEKCDLCLLRDVLDGFAADYGSERLSNAEFKRSRIKGLILGIAGAALVPPGPPTGEQ